MKKFKVTNTTNTLAPRSGHMVSFYRVDKDGKGISTCLFVGESIEYEGEVTDPMKTLEQRKWIKIEETVNQETL